LCESISPRLGICCSSSPSVAGSRSSIALAPSTVSGVGARTPAGSRDPVTTMSLWLSGAGVGAGACCAYAGNASRLAAAVKRERRTVPARLRLTFIGSSRLGQQKSPPVRRASVTRGGVLAPTPSPRTAARRSPGRAPPELPRNRRIGRDGDGGGVSHERWLTGAIAYRQRRDLVRVHFVL